MRRTGRSAQGLARGVAVGAIAIAASGCGVPVARVGAVPAGSTAGGATFRIEVHPVATLSPTTAQALAGATEDLAPATIAGELRLPMTTASRVPAVVFLHGDAGAIANQAVWNDELNALGIAVFTLDSFTGRGAVARDSALGSIEPPIGATARVVDAERALALLAAHPRIDPQRIAVMGVSSGGRTALTTAMTRFASVYGRPGLRFAATIAFYPSCNVELIDEVRLEPGAPLRIYIGEADVLTPADACVRYGERLRRAGFDATVTTFPGAHHGFDNVSNPGLTRLPDAPTSGRCTVREVSRGRLVNVDTGRPLAPEDACFTKGFVAGYDEPANAATRAAVKAFLAERLGLAR